MRLLRLLCLVILAASSCSENQSEDISIAYKVLEVYPKSRRVLITCDAAGAPRPITYTLLASRGVQVASRVVDNHSPASFNINITLKSRPDLLTYSCQAASPSGNYGPSAKLQMYWELWAKPVSQLQADFAFGSGASGPTLELSCLATSGSPPITYSLVGSDGHVYLQQRPPHGQPANFSLPLSGTSGGFHCQAENSAGVLRSGQSLRPPGELALVPAFVLAGSLVSIAAIGSGMLGWVVTRRSRRGRVL